MDLKNKESKNAQKITKNAVFWPFLRKILEKIEIMYVKRKKCNFYIFLMFYVQKIDVKKS